MRGLDWLILALYCGAVLAVALYFRARAGKGVEQFFLADRALPWWVIGFADVAGYTGGGQGFVMMFFLSGFAGLWLMAWVSWVIWMPLVALLWAPMWRRLNVVTTGEFIERRYAGRRARTYRHIYAVYACFAWGVVSLAYIAAWMATTMAPLLGWSPTNLLLVFGGLTIVYALVSGLFAVAYNDVLQFVLLMGGNTVFGCLLLIHAGGLGQVWQKIAVARGADFLQSFPSGSALSGISLVALCVQGLFFAGSPFAGEGWTAQRYMAAKNERHAVLGQMFNGLLALVVRLIPFLLIGLAAAAMFPLSSVPLPAAVWSSLVQQYAPAGLFGLLLVSSLAGYMAAIASIGNWAASYLMNDVYRLSVRPNASNREFVTVSRLMTGVVLAVSFVLGARIDPSGLDKWVLFINSALVVFPLPLAWLKWFWWRTNAIGDMAGVLGALPAGYIVWFGSDAVVPAGFREWARHSFGIPLSGLIPAFSDFNRFPFWMGFGILFALGWVTILACTLFTSPEPFAVLKSFFETVRPIGLWGPVSRTLPQEERQTLRARNKRTLGGGAFGIVFYFLLVLSSFSFIGGRLTEGSLEAIATIVAGVLFWRAAVHPETGDFDGCSCSSPPLP